MLSTVFLIVIEYVVVFPSYVTFKVFVKLLFVYSETAGLIFTALPSVSVIITSTSDIDIEPAGPAE